VATDLPAELDRRFEAFVFDWEGTAVPDRRADASAVRAAIERLCALGADVAVISDTDLGNLDAQLGARPAARAGSSSASTTAASSSASTPTAHGSSSGLGRGPRRTRPLTAPPRSTSSAD
jgi:hypothetical protein